MATAVAASAPRGDLEQGHIEPEAARRIRYTRDITCKLIPICIGILVMFSLSGILAYQTTPPRKATVVVCSLLGVFFLLFFVGAIYLYRLKHYPRLTKSPDASDNDPQNNVEEFIKPQRDQGPIKEDSINKDKPAEMEDTTRRGDDGQQPNMKPPKPAGNQARGDHGPRDQRGSAPPSHMSPNRDPSGRGRSHTRQPWTPAEGVINEETQEYDQSSAPAHTSNMSTRAMREYRISSVNSEGYGGARMHANPRPRSGRPVGTPIAILPEYSRTPGYDQNVQSIPRTHFVYIPESISNRAFCQSIPVEFASGGLNVFDDYPGLRACGIKVTKLAGKNRSHLRKLQDHHLHSKIAAISAHKDIPKGPYIQIEFSEDLGTPIGSFSLRCKGSLNVQIVAGGSGIIIIGHKVSNNHKARDVLGAECKHKGTSSSSMSRHPQAQEKRHETDENKQQSSPPPQKVSQTKTPPENLSPAQPSSSDPDSVTSPEKLRPALLKLPGPPRKVKQLYRWDSKMMDEQQQQQRVEDGSRNPPCSKPSSSSSKTGKGQERGRGEPRAHPRQRRRSTPPDTDKQKGSETDCTHLYKPDPARPGKEKAQPLAWPGPEYAGGLFDWPPATIPPRTSSKRLLGNDTATCKTASGKSSMEVCNEKS
ncbi:hypothetical protein GGR54DRAFT_639081 [Hypoxylon sp. NC1633]|nr:hypothetical protein GGR54DRAFT_639081 [Hypoxylon sp. NC1633]